MGEEMYKLSSMNLCSNTVGQAMTASIINPPTDQEVSFPLYQEEKQKIFCSLKKKAQIVFEGLNAIPGVRCMPVEGAMYAFPEVKLPRKFVEHCKSESVNKEPDSVYCIEMLEKIGVITVPGNGFGQREGTYHYRITILPEEEELRRVLGGLEQFQKEFYEEWGNPEEE